MGDTRQLNYNNYNCIELISLNKLFKVVTKTHCHLSTIYQRINVTGIESAYNSYLYKMPPTLLRNFNKGITCHILDTIVCF